MYMHVPVGSVQVGCNNSETELLSPYLLFKIGFLHCQHFFIAELSKQVLIFVQAKAFQPNRDLCVRKREREREGCGDWSNRDAYTCTVSESVNKYYVS